MNSPLRALAVSLLCLLAASPPAPAASALLTKIFVASYGSDANAGTSTAPKRTFQAAHDAVAAGGEIVVLDTAGYGAFTITKSLAVTVPPGVNGFVTVNSGNAITVNAATTDTVSLRGLVIEGPAPNIGTFGIVCNSAGSLLVEDCSVRGFGNGVNFRPDNIAASLLVRGGTYRNCLNGVFVSASGASGAVIATVTDCAVLRCTFSGVEAAGSPTTGATVKLTASRCVFTDNYAGLETALSDNAAVVADACVFTGNTYGFYQDENYGIIFSRGNNVFAYNTNNINAPNTPRSLAGY